MLVGKETTRSASSQDICWIADSVILFVNQTRIVSHPRRSSTTCLVSANTMPGRGRGRGRGRGPGPGRGRARAVRAAHAAAAHQQQAQAQQAQQKEGEEDKKEETPKEAEKEPKQQVSSECEFPRCDKPPEFGFSDEGSYPQFCAEHKSNEMVLLVADPDNPSESSLERVRQYKKMEPELDALKEAPEKAAACKAEIKTLTREIHTEDEDIKKITKKIDELNADLSKQEKKPKRTGKTLFGKGKIFQDQGVIDKLTKDKENQEQKVVDIKGQKEINDAKLNQLKEDLQGLAKDADEYASIEETMKDLKATAIESEASALYLQLKAKGMETEMNAEGEVIFQRLVEKA